MFPVDNEEESFDMRFNKTVDSVEAPCQSITSDKEQTILLKYSVAGKKENYKTKQILIDFTGKDTRIFKDFKESIKARCSIS
jgi:hypothetical protein